MIIQNNEALESSKRKNIYRACFALEKNCCFFYRHGDNKFNCIISIQALIPEHYSKRLLFFRSVQAFEHKHRLHKPNNLDFFCYVCLDNCIFFNDGKENGPNYWKNADENLCCW